MLKKLASTTILTLSLAAGTAAFGQAAQSYNSKPSADATKTLTGVVSDSMCGAKHMAKNRTAAECTHECVKAGSDFALVVGKKVYVLKGNQADIDKLAGKRATVRGFVSGNTVTIKSIAATKKGTES